MIDIDRWYYFYILYIICRVCRSTTFIFQTLYTLHSEYINISTLQFLKALWILEINSV